MSVAFSLYDVDCAGLIDDIGRLNDGLIDGAGLLDGAGLFDGAGLVDDAGLADDVSLT